MSFISSFLSSKTRIVRFECSFACRYCCFKTIVFIINRLFSTIFYTNILLTNNSLYAWPCRTRYKLCSLLLFKYYFATKLLCIRFEPNLMWLYKSLNNNFSLILLFNNLYSSSVPFIHTLIIFPEALLP